MVASQITMFMQQFCGINVIAYYSSEIFLQAKFSQLMALVCSLGFGASNFLFAIPVFYSKCSSSLTPTLITRLTKPQPSTSGAAGLCSC